MPQNMLVLTGHKTLPILAEFFRAFCTEWVQKYLKKILKEAYKPDWDFKRLVRPSPLSPPYLLTLIFRSLKLWWRSTATSSASRRSRSSKP